MCSKVTWQYTFELLLDICCQVQSEQKYLIYLPEGEWYYGFIFCTFLNFSSMLFGRPYLTSSCFIWEKINTKLDTDQTFPMLSISTTFCINTRLGFLLAVKLSECSQYLLGQKMKKALLGVQWCTLTGKTHAHRMLNYLLTVYMLYIFQYWFLVRPNETSYSVCGWNQVWRVCCVETCHNIGLLNNIFRVDHILRLTNWY